MFSGKKKNQQQTTEIKQQQRLKDLWYIRLNWNTVYSLLSSDSINVKSRGFFLNT